MKTVALAGGVGGAKMVDGLAQVLEPEDLTVIANTGDDFQHFGLYICPDLDTIVYTLAGIANPQTGWGRSDETWNALDIIEQLGGPTWFRLGDADIGLHLERSRRLMEGDPLSRICKDVCDSLGITVQILPMSDDRVPTWVSTAEGELPFQEYFVLRQCQPEVTGFRFENAGMAHPSPGVMEAIGEADLVVICPSNPWVSVDPILSIPGVREAVAGRMTVAVSPIIGGRALKGPAAKMYAELGIDPSAVSVARHYNGLIDRIVIDNLDVGLAGEIEALGIQPLVTDTVMKTRPDRRRLAKNILETGSMAPRSPGDE